MSRRATRKARLRLGDRRAGYQATIQSRSDNGKGFKEPGSLSGKK